MAESLSVEAVNQMRIAMGMKPIPVPGAPSEGPSFKTKEAVEEDVGSTYELREAAADDNWAKLQADAKAKEDRQKKKEHIKKARDAAERNKKLVGKSLADVEDEDTLSWLKTQNKRVKRLEKEQKEAEEREAQRKRAEYTAADLAGVKVGHELGEFDAGEEQILVLKDAEIGEEEEEDELENLDLRDKEKLNERLESKKRKPVYNPNDVDENGEKSLLSQYDDVDGKKRTRFTLDGKGSTKEAANVKEDAEERSNGLLISLDMLKDDKPVSDYKDISEIKMRKPKKEKKSKSKRKKAADDEDIFPMAAEADAMEVDTGATNGAAPKKKRLLDDTAFDDDEDLQAELARQRREALKKRKKNRPEDLAKQLREEEETAMDGIIDSVEQDDGGLIIDETTEFVQNLRPEDEADEEAKERRRRKSSVPKSHTPPGKPDAEGDTEMQQSYGALEDAEDAAERAQRQASSLAPDVNTNTGLEEEGTLDKGVAGTLNMLRQRGLIKDTGSADMQGSFEDRQRFLIERRKREEDAERKARLQRERDRASGRLDRMSAREREDYARQNNTNREQAESRQLADMFNRDYKPTVDLKYVDEFGRHMDQKEAFKHLSHQFHGKGSGKQKHEKRLKKIEDEKKKEAMSTLDSSQHASSSAMGDKAKRSKQAGVRLQ